MQVPKERVKTRIPWVEFGTSVWGSTVLFPSLKYWEVPAAGKNQRAKGHQSVGWFIGPDLVFSSYATYQETVFVASGGLLEGLTTQHSWQESRQLCTGFPLSPTVSSTQGERVLRGWRTGTIRPCPLKRNRLGLPTTVTTSQEETQLLRSPGQS